MTTENIADVDGVRSIEELDAVFEALGDWRRRAVVTELAREDPQDVDELAERVAEEDQAAAASNVAISLVHCHLPKLDDADVITYDDSEQRCALSDTERARTTREVLRTVRARI